MDKRPVTERDLRRPEFRDGDPAEYEFREDGEIVRKDRWERGIRQIAMILKDGSRGDFEIDNLVYVVDWMVSWLPDSIPKCEQCGSALSENTLLCTECCLEINGL